MAVLLLAPLLFLARQSFLPFSDGQPAASGLTTDEYGELVDPAYAFYFYDTFRLSALVAALATALGAPLAFTCARTQRPGLRRAILLLLVGMLFMSLVARLYAIEVSFARTGPLSWVGPMLGAPPGRPGFAVTMVVFGLLHYILPPTALLLVGTFQNLNPRLEEAAALLGASRLRIVLDVVIPLAAPGMIAAALLAFTMSISNLVVPLVLGRGIAVFTTNLIYVRVSETANYPLGAAIAMLMLLASGVLVYAVSRIVTRLYASA
jgi:ABC-type spermidine/putrescine transport system permease subunit I